MGFVGNVSRTGRGGHRRRPSFEEPLVARPGAPIIRPESPSGDGVDRSGNQ